MQRFLAIFFATVTVSMAQIAPVQTTLALRAGQDDLQVVLSSLTGVQPGHYLLIDHELMSVYGSLTRGPVARVLRGLLGTPQSSHAQGATVWAAPKSSFWLTEPIPGADCNLPSDFPILVISTAAKWSCTNGVYTPPSTSGVSNWADLQGKPPTFTLPSTGSWILLYNAASPGTAISLPWDGSVTPSGTDTMALTWSGTAVHWGNFSGSPAPSYTLSASPSSRSITAGNTTTYTLTATVSNGPMPTTIAPSVTGLPSNTTVSYSPTTIPATGGTTTATVTTTTSTPAATSSLAFKGTVNAATVTASAVSLTVSAAPAAGVTFVSYSDVGSGSVNLTTAFPSGWVHSTDDYSSGTNPISGHAATGTGCGNPTVFADSSNLQTYSWTNGTNTASGSSSTDAFVLSACGIGFTATLADTGLHRFGIYVLATGGASGSGISSTAQLSTQGSSTTQAQYNTDGNAKYTLVLWDVRAANAGDTVSIYVYGNNVTRYFFAAGQVN